MLARGRATREKRLEQGEEECYYGKRGECERAGTEDLRARAGLLEASGGELRAVDAGVQEALGPGELEGEHRESDRDDQERGAGERDHDDAGDGDGEAGEHPEASVDRAVLAVCAAASLQPLDQLWLLVRIAIGPALLNVGLWRVDRVDDYADLDHLQASEFLDLFLDVAAQLLSDVRHGNAIVEDRFDVGGRLACADAPVIFATTASLIVVVPRSDGEGGVTSRRDRIGRAWVAGRARACPVRR